MMTTRDSSPATPELRHEIGSTGRLSVRVADWDVRLSAATGDEAVVRDSGGRPLSDEIEIERGPGSLSVRQVTRLSGLGFLTGRGREHGTLEIELPPDASAKVHTASGNIQATGLRGEQLFRTASGAVHVLRATGQLTAETVSGQVSVSVAGSLEFTAKTVSGAVAVDDGRLDRLSLATTSGDIRLSSELGEGPHAIETLSGDALIASGRGVRITARTLTGDLSSDLPHTSEGGPGRRTVVIGDGSTELRFRSVSGGLRVLDPERSRPTLAPAAALDTDGSRLEVLRALERGEIDIAEATDRLARLEGPTDA